MFSLRLQSFFKKIFFFSLCFNLDSFYCYVFMFIFFCSINLLLIILSKFYFRYCIFNTYISFIIIYLSIYYDHVLSELLITFIIVELKAFSFNFSTNIISSSASIFSYFMITVCCFLSSTFLLNILLYILQN